MEWIAASRHRLPLVLALYFLVHVIIRVMLSNSLDFDESEQVFLSQFLALGYNSQPPHSGYTF